MKVVALCKTFAGHEWIVPSFLSIYPYVDKIVYVNSDTSWNGRHGNSCKTSIQYMMEHLDPDNKIVSLDYDTIDQFEQCMFGYKYIQKNLEADYVMLIDTDEVWDSHDLEVAKNIIRINPEYKFYKTNLYTYIKSPLYRVDPREPLEPVSFIRADLQDSEEGANDALGVHARCCDPEFHKDTFLLRDTGDQNKRLYYHHYVYVREDFNTILEKIITSNVSEHRFYQDMSIWIPEVWNKLPDLEGVWAEGFHPAVGFRKCWTGLKEIKVSEMPKVLREGNFPILKQHGVVN